MSTACLRSRVDPSDKVTYFSGDEFFPCSKFISLFHSRSDSTALNTNLKPGDFNSIMPWTMYGKMTDADLEAIYTYLRTVTPIKNDVVKYTAAK